MLHFLSSASLQDLVQTWGLWLVFGLVMMESMGLPLPGETALISAALFAGATHEIDIALVVAVAALGAVIGDNIGFAIGRTIGFRLLLRYGRYVRMTEPRLKIGQYLFLRHGGKIVFFGRFVAFLRAFAALLAGANRMRWAKFLLMNALGGVCWAGIYGFGAFFFGEAIRRMAAPMGFGLLALGVLAALGGLLFFRRHERELAARADLAFPGPLIATMR
ncbi:DedA family protein [Aurantimonas sp. VKM B-3413]|uniref:DedA family protein n=1 Tax=Aurantimonas sp. VKM B-3413 TaxID=2779401 RepID=UPI001E4611FA|nr:DedA family protein [Aurantimonas sp. VKM B-3413]MCB8838466.1 DedA family protein [Aurantimonas sp. VKM B-3413]